VPPLSEEAIRVRQTRAREDEKTERTHEVYMARLDAELARLKAQIKSHEPKSSREKLEQSYSDHDSHFMAVHEIRRRERVANQKKYADDSEMFQRSEESLDHWVNQQTIES
jgi:hypothetical protein